MAKVLNRAESRSLNDILGRADLEPGMGALLLGAGLGEVMMMADMTVDPPPLMN